jgi:methyl halide transferase
MEEENKEIVCCNCSSPAPLGKEFWESQYASGYTGWDLGMVSPPLKDFIDQVEDKSLRILIPGCGNAYEAEYLSAQGFTNITLVDIAPTATERARKMLGDKVKVIEGDFIDLEGKYDLILEQTFFCALDPVLRKAYVAKTHDLLTDGGKIAGVMFNKAFDKQGPPFGGTSEAYRELFMDKFHIKTLAPCYNSVPPRAGTEVFIQFIKI